MNDWKRWDLNPLEMPNDKNSCRKAMLGLL